MTYLITKLPRSEIITPKQQEWLWRRGGRSEKDVLQDPDGKKFVYMGDGVGGVVKVYLPNTSSKALKE